MGRVTEMKDQAETYGIEMPKDYAVDILAREIFNLEQKIGAIHYCLADGDPDDELSGQLEGLQEKLDQCRKGIRAIYIYEHEQHHL
jgi:hypothetical protein